MIFLWILVAIVMFSVIVMIHEFGHFKTARLFWVKVYEFWLGIPPKAKKLFTDKLWTEYTLNWLPIWGFVRMKWENLNYFLVFDKNKIQIKQENIEKILKSDKKVFDKDWDEISELNKKEILKQLKENKDNDNLVNKPYWQQSIVILAWVFMNFLLAIFIFTILFTVWLKPVWINSAIKTDLDIKVFPTFEQAVKDWLLIQKEWIILYPMTWSIAYNAWIKNEDLLQKVNWIVVNSPDDVKNIIWENSKKELLFDINRWWENIGIYITPSQDWKIGSYLAPNIEYNKEFEYKYNLWTSFVIASKETFNQSLLTLKALGIFVRKLVIPTTKEERSEAINSVSWPVWIVSIVTDSIKSWITILFILWAIISISLWVFNLLPLPALDWWRFALMSINELIRKVTWKKLISPHIEWVIHLSFFVILIFLSIIVTYNDVIKIINK